MHTRFIALTLSAVALAGAAHAGTTQVHVVTASGRAAGANCNTSGPTPGAAFYGSGVSIPAGGHAGCGLAGGIKDIAGGDGPISAHLDLSNVFGGGLNTASADAVAELGSLGVSAIEDYTGQAADNTTYLSAEAGASWSDMLDYGGTGMGYVEWAFDVEGVMTLGGMGGELLTYLNYQVEGGPIYTAFFGKLSSTADDFVTNPTGVGGLTGFTVTPTSIIGGDTAFSYRHYVDLSKPFAFKAGLYTAAYTRAGSSAHNDFLHTAKLTGIRVFDERGNPLEAHFTGASGTLYGANGVLSAGGAVPEPSTWLLALLGFGLAGAGLRRRRPAPVGDYT